MNCMNHPDRPAVTTCVKCSTGMCPECVATGISVDSKAICRSCAPEVLRASISEQKSQLWKDKLKFRLIVGLILIGVAVGIVASFMDPVGGANNLFLFPVLAMSIAGAVSIIRFGRKARTVYDEVSDAVNPEFMFVKWFISLFFALIFGVVVAPFNLYRYHRAFKNGEQSIREHEELLRKVTGQQTDLAQAS